MTTWRDEKRIANLLKHGVDLAAAEAFEWSAAEIREDRTEDYREQRFRAVGPIRDKLYVYVYAENGDGSDHAISLREATRKEKRDYARSI